MKELLNKEELELVELAQKKNLNLKLLTEGVRLWGVFRLGIQVFQGNTFETKNYLIVIMISMIVIPDTM